MGTGPAEGVLFDLDGCNHEWCVFDIRRHSSGSSPDGYGRERKRLQLDSGYYIEEEARLALQDGAKRPSKGQEVVESQVDPGTMRVVIHHKGEAHEWEVSPQDTVQ